MLELLDYLFERLIVKCFLLGHKIKVLYLALITKILWYKSAKDGLKGFGVVVTKSKDSNNYVATHCKSELFEYGKSEIDAVYNLFSKYPEIKRKDVQ